MTMNIIQEAKGLSIRGLSVDFRLANRVISAVRNVSFDVSRGMRMGLVGESGSGKTTTAMALLGMIRPPGLVTAGSAMLDGPSGPVELLRLSEREMLAARLKTVSYIPQGAMNSLNPVLRIEESFREGMVDHGLSLSTQDMRDRIAELLELVGLPAATARQFPHELSGGMKQRVCIALAVSLDPALIIADEPTSALDVITQRQVMATLEKVQEKSNSSLLMIGHDMGLMAQFVHRLAVMKDGEIVEAGPVREIFKTPKNPYTRELIGSVPVLGKARTDNRSETAPDLSDSKTLMSFENVEKRYQDGPLAQGKLALGRLSMSISERPAIVALVGQSGSGKTTLGNLMLGSANPTTGSVKYHGSDIRHLRGSETQKFRAGVQAVFQDPYGTFNPFYRVRNALSVPLKLFGIARTEAERQEKMEKACREVGLDPHAVLDRYPHELSGGQRQRIMIARILMLRPKLLVADEPVSMVDASLRSSILGEIKALKESIGVFVMYITHDLTTAYEISDYVVVLLHGRIVEAGTPQEVIGSPKHPYTKLLVESVPSPDPDIPWMKSSQLERDANQAGLIEAPATIRSLLPGFSLSVDYRDGRP